MPKLSPQMARRRDALKATPLKSLDAAIANLTVEQLMMLVRDLEAEAAGAARLAAYLALRAGYGQGDQGHARAVKECNRVARAVRRALGYHTTPDINF